MSNPLTIESGQKIITEVLAAYPEAARADREKHLYVNDQSMDTASSCVSANRKSLPGVMTIRGCAYAGSKGVVWGPVKDMVHISHGPIGCGQYSWGTRRNYSSGEYGIDNFVVFQITSDFQERDIVFGGDKKLEQMMREIVEMFPLAKGISIMSECPVGLIGDDIEAVAKRMSVELNMPIVPVRCEGFRGVSQSLGHHIANDSVRDHILGKAEPDVTTDYDVTLLGDYNIGGDAWASRLILEEMGLRVIGQWSGDATLNEMQTVHKSKLNLLHCYRSMNYICRTMEEKYGIPWMEYNFFGPSKIEASIRAIAARFDAKIQANAEKVIARHKPLMEAVIGQYRPRLEGKKVMLYVGGLRPRHVIGAYEDLGMEVIGAGYEFGHNDDYDRTIKEAKNATLIYDDVTNYEFEKFVEKLKPDLVGSGIKEKYTFQKMGVPFRQMHSWDYSGPYHGYDGFGVFARDMDMAVNAPAYKMITPPWKGKA
ncbi:MAG: nitrogenase molybdenum-iron protein alpha chain [Nitrospinae bacterium]|nr:nitrogenase molybdenum-iron protein alpha chain [Nitrospinota bacterium]